MTALSSSRLAATSISMDTLSRGMVSASSVRYTYKQHAQARGSKVQIWHVCVWTPCHTAWPAPPPCATCTSNMHERGSRLRVWHVWGRHSNMRRQSDTQRAIRSDQLSAQNRIHVYCETMQGGRAAGSIVRHRGMIQLSQVTMCHTITQHIPEN